MSDKEMAAQLRYLYGVDTWCGRGWYPLLLELGTRLRAEFPNCTFSQVKEKAGGLRVYGHAGDGANVERWSELIAAAESRSLSACELCGEPGECGVNKGWRSTLCPEHRRMSIEEARAFLELRRDAGA